MGNRLMEHYLYRHFFFRRIYIVTFGFKNLKDED